jgi:RNA polymerase sigma factor (sigma-70 family)
MYIANEELQINEHVNLVHFVIHKFYKYHPSIEYEDLFQIGNIGLLQAVRTYESNHGACFSTWAVLQIKTAIGNALRKSHAKKRTGVVVSLNKPIGDDSHELLDVIPKFQADEVFENACLNLMLSDRKTFTNVEIKILQSLTMGQSMSDIAESTGLTCRKVSALLSKLKSKVYILLGREKSMKGDNLKIQAIGNIEKSAKVSTAWDLSDFIVFDATNTVGSRDSYIITVGKSGRVTLSSPIGRSYQVGNKLEVMINKKLNIIAVRQSDKGITCRPNGPGSQGKLINCKALLNHLNQNKIPLPIKFTAEYDEQNKAWVGKR